MVSTGGDRNALAELRTIQAVFNHAQRLCERNLINVDAFEVDDRLSRRGRRRGGTTGLIKNVRAQQRRQLERSRLPELSGERNSGGVCGE
jgi:hypothetical protein